MSIKITMSKRFYSHDCTTFSRFDKETLYLVGLIASDGNTSKTVKASDRIKLATCDAEIPYYFKIITKAQHPIRISLSKRKEWNTVYEFLYRCNDCSKQLLDNFGIDVRKSLTIQFPKKLIDHPLQHHFIRGYVDGDGSFIWDRSRDRFISSIMGTDNFLSMIKKIFDDRCNIDSAPKRMSFSHGQHSLIYTGTEYVQKITQYLYQDCDELFLPCKYQMARLSFHPSLSPVIKEPICKSIEFPLMKRIDNRIFSINDPVLRMANQTEPIDFKLKSLAPEHHHKVLPNFYFDCK